MSNRVIGRPKDLQKRHAILEAARELFLEFGYDGSSMEKIAKKAGVSKLTVYSHFQDKTQLFGAAIELACEQKLPKHLFVIDASSHVPTVLYDLGFSFLSMLYSPEAIKLSHLMSSLVCHNADLVHLFYRAGPLRTHNNIFKLFEQIQQFEQMSIPDCTIAADLFLSLLTDVHFDRVMWHVNPVPTASQIQQHVAQRLEIFLKIYPLKNT